MTRAMTRKYTSNVAAVHQWSESTQAFTVRMDPVLYQTLTTYSICNNQSTNAVVNLAVQEYLGAHGGGVATTVLFQDYNEIIELLGRKTK